MELLLPAECCVYTDYSLSDLSKTLSCVVCVSVSVCSSSRFVLPRTFMFCGAIVASMPSKLLGSATLQADYTVMPARGAENLFLFSRGS